MKRNIGLTESERYLDKLCRKTFLSLWSYPGVYRDQKNGKEVCDLLVIFGKHVIIFSDKYCKFPNTGNLSNDWNRWFKRAILHSAKQAWGAERWIREYPDRLFLDHTCTNRIPIEIPSSETAVFHLIVVAHGSAKRCQQESGGSGSLEIYTDIVGDRHWQGDETLPFLIGDLDKSRTFVHVLDDFSLDVVLQTLDTVSDFIAYLEKKEALLRSPLVVNAVGEENLLVNYLFNIDEKGQHDFVPSMLRTDLLLIGDGHWQRWRNHPKYTKKKRAEADSYNWDRLIEVFSKSIQGEDSYEVSNLSISEQEKALRFMASESRFFRRMLVDKLLELKLDTGLKSDKIRRIFFPIPERKLCYVFMVFAQPDDLSYEDYREMRLALLGLVCHGAKLNYPDIEDVVGIAFNPGLEGSHGSEDLYHIDLRIWTEEMEKDVESLLEEIIPVDVRRHHLEHYDEYPLIENAVDHKQPRNAPCYCGSGLKYKRCHGRPN